MMTMMLNNVVAPCCAKQSISLADQEEGHHRYRHCHLGRHQFLVILAWFGAISTMMTWLRPPRPPPAVEKRSTTACMELTMVGDDHDDADHDDVDVIAIDYDSTLGKDVAEIIHYRRNATVLVTMHPNVSCRHPVLRGRLSGPALIILEWERHTVNNRTTRLSGRYDHHLLPTGMLCYDVEIIALLCEEWDYDTNFQPVCLENPERHRVTAWNASIMVLPPVGPTNNVVVLANDNANVAGRWVRQRQYDDDDKLSIIDENHRPLYTRWQRKTCGWHKTDYCPEETNSLDRFRPYKFRWEQQNDDGGSSLEDQIHKVWWDNNNDRNNDGPKNATTTTTTTRRLCYVGDSHAEQLFKSTKLLLSSPGGKTTKTKTGRPTA
jgi:hypothetical protein